MGSPARPVLVGRAAELDRLVSTVLSPPAVAVVEGEEGIGKTRLVAELRAHPALAGRRFLVGEFRRLREPFPLGPVVEALRGLAPELGRVVLSPVAGALRPLLPELAPVLPDRPEPLDDRAAERHRVFRGLTDLLRALGPTVVVLEDAHWADGQTVDFLSYLLSDPPITIAVLLTFRGDEVDPAVRALTARLPDPVRRERISLSPLDADGTGALAAAILGVDRVSTEFAAHLCLRASGLPFAVQELLALLRARGSLRRRGSGWARKALDELDVPAGIRDLVRERMARLDAEARAILEASAVLQVPVPLDVLVATAVTGDGLPAAFDSGLLAEDGGGTGFRHVLAAQTVYEDLTPPRRRELHDRAASVVQAREPVRLGQLAHHLRYAGRFDEWVTVAEQAAAQAIGLGDDAQAIGLLADVLRHAPLDADRRGRVAVRLARAAVDALQYAADVVHLLAEVVEGDLPAEVRGELRFLVYGPLGDPDSDPEGWYPRLASTLDDLTDRPDLRAWAMVGLGIPRAAGMSLDEHLVWLRRALDSLGEVTDAAFASFLLGKIVMIHVAIGDPSWRALAERLVERTGGAPRGRYEVIAYESVADEAACAGHYDMAEFLLDRAWQGAAYSENRALELRVLTSQAFLDHCRGRWDGLRERLDTMAEELGDGPPRPVELQVTAACFAAVCGDHNSALGTLTELVGYLEVAHGLDVLPLPLAALARLAVARGELDLVLPRIGPYLSAVAAQSAWPTAARAVPSLVSALVSAGRPDDARELVARFARGSVDVDAPLASAALSYARGFMSDPAEAVEHFRAAADRYATLGCPYESAQALEHAAGALFGSGGPGADPLREALSVYVGLGAHWDVERATGLARRNEVPLPARHRGGPRGYGTALSPRERQVAELAATGRTNREIAHALFLSPNTVDKHLGAALRKLGLRTRTALAYHLHSTPDAGA